MILVDTSVWIRTLAGRLPFVDGARDLIERSEALAHDLVQGELLIGDRGGRRVFFAMFSRLPRVPVARHDEVLALVRERRLHGRGISWVDAHLLASALIGQHRLWTADERLAAVATDLGVGWRAR